MEIIARARNDSLRAAVDRGEYAQDVWCVRKDSLRVAADRGEYAQDFWCEQMGDVLWCEDTEDE